MATSVRNISYLLRLPSEELTEDDIVRLSHQFAEDARHLSVEAYNCTFAPRNISNRRVVRMLACLKACGERTIKKDPHDHALWNALGGLNRWLVACQVAGCDDCFEVMDQFFAAGLMISSLGGRRDKSPHQRVSS